MNLNPTQQKVAIGLGVAAVGAVLAGYLYKRTKGRRTSESGEHDKTEVVEDIEEEEDDVTKAKRMKELGNKAFASAQYDKAVYYYSEGLRLSSIDSHLLYSNRSAAHAASGNLTEAVNDAKKCIELNPEWSKGYFRLGKALLASGEFDQAYMVFYKGLKVEPKNKDLKEALTVARQELSFGEFDTRSKVDSKMIKHYYKRLLAKYCTQDLGTDLPTVKNIVKEAVKSKKADQLLSDGVISAAYKMNPAVTLRVLAQLLLDQGRPEDSLIYARQARDAEPSNPQAIQLVTSGTLRSKNADITEVLSLIRQAFQLDEKDVLVSHTLASVLLRITQTQGVQMDSEKIRGVLKELKSALMNPYTNQLLIADCGIRMWFKLFEDPIIQHMLTQEEQANMSSNSTPSQAYLRGLYKGAFSKLCLEPFFMQALSQIVFNNPGLERVLAPFRTAFGSMQFSETDENKAMYKKLSPFIFAMSLQCFRNNYSWNVTDEDETHIRVHLNEVTELLERKEPEHLVEDGVLNYELAFELSIVALYRSLDGIRGLYDVIKLCDMSKMSEKYHEWFAAVLKKEVLDPQQERTIRSDVEFGSVSTIESSPLLDYYNAQINNTFDSAGVSAGRMIKISFKEELEWIFPGYQPKDFDKTPTRVLIAGCGSGSEVIQTATLYDNVEITAVDISSRNLAYAIRQNKDLGVEAKFYNADILQDDLQLPNAPYDVVLAHGILSHLSDPLRGFEKLANLVRPGGIIRASLLDSRFVSFVADCRRFLSTKFNNPIFDKSATMPKLLRNPNMEEVRSARNYLIDSQVEAIEEEILQTPSFYALNEFRDLLFHPQLQASNFSAIGEMIDRLGLKLVGFEFPQIAQEVVLQYRIDYPDDPKMQNVTYLDEFEQVHPGAFRNISNAILFTCEKPL